MSQLSSPPLNLGHPFEIAVQIQTYSPTSFSPSQPLIVSDVINPNTINLPVQTDLVCEASLETLRKYWEAHILTPHAIAITHDYPDSETLVNRAFRKVAAEIGDASLVALIQEARFPIPPDYTIALPQIKRLERQHIMESLVPFRETLSMLKRMEDSFELPIATVRIASQRIDKPQGMHLN